VCLHRAHRRRFTARITGPLHRRRRATHGSVPLRHAGALRVNARITSHAERCGAGFSLRGALAPPLRSYQNCAAILARSLIAETLEELGAPKGSTLRVAESGTVRAFGNAEGMAVYLNGTDLPAETGKTRGAGQISTLFSRAYFKSALLPRRPSFWQMRVRRFSTVR